MTNWLKSQFLALILALVNVEKNALKQNGGNLSDDVGQEQQIQQNQFLQDLIQGRVTQEVKFLRWRIFKILENIQGKDITVKEQADGTVEYTAKDKNYSHKLKKIKTDPSDDNKLELVIDNLTNTTMGQLNLLDADNENINASEHDSLVKGDSKIKIKHTYPSKFRLEKYVKKMNVRTDENNTRLLELYVTMYPDEYDRLHKMFITEVKKAIINPRTSSILDIDEIQFITNKDLGITDNKEYLFNEVRFYKIVEFDGHYVIKFKANVKTYGHSIIEQFREHELDMRYENMESKDSRNKDINYVDALTYLNI
jgi:hypothetical protein